MDSKMFRKYGYELVDWIAQYMETVEDYPVLAKVKPGHIFKRLPSLPPDEPVSMDTILDDFKQIIMPGITHWQHPSFFAYFPANTSEPSILAELLTAAIGAQCMVWQTSPAATELEELVMDWVRHILGLPADFTGVIQDSASTSTLCAVLCAREYVTQYKVNREGLNQGSPGALRVYASEEAHSSITKGVKIAGFGEENLKVISTDRNYAMIPERLEEAILDDKHSGKNPCCVVATVGTTSSTAIDPIRSIAEICRSHGVWLHVDAALAGTAAILPEFRYILEGIDKADSFVFNPHKWLFTNFDCSAYFCRDPKILTSTFEILPEYLKTQADREVKNLRDWGIPLGRRFRALKLWFVIRYFGVTGLQEKIRTHIQLTREFESWVRATPDFEVMAPAPLNLVCFRYNPQNRQCTEEQLASMNQQLLNQLNLSGKMFLTHTKLKGKFSLRMCIGQTNTERRHVTGAWGQIKELAHTLS